MKTRRGLIDHRDMPPEALSPVGAAGAGPRASKSRSGSRLRLGTDDRDQASPSVLASTSPLHKGRRPASESLAPTDNAGPSHGSDDHVPVLLAEVLAGLDPRPGGRYIDGTAGRGGHSAAILERSAPDGMLLALDADPVAVEAVRVRLSPFGSRAVVVQMNFRDIAAQVAAQGDGWAAGQIDGLLLDLGLSSPQLAHPERGFSFATNGPLDMRFDPRSATTAEDLVNDLSEGDLADLIYRYGEEPRSHRVARTIVDARTRGRLTSTAQVAALVERALGRRSGLHPATRVFQALRIAVNDELDTLTAVLPQAVSLLRPGGRLAIIAFHSLEDRIVKRFLQQEMATCVCPGSQPVCTCTHRPTMRAVSRGAVMAGDDEVRSNRRARSARLRVAERLSAS